MNNRRTHVLFSSVEHARTRLVCSNAKRLLFLRGSFCSSLAKGCFVHPLVLSGMCKCVYIYCMCIIYIYTVNIYLCSMYIVYMYIYICICRVCMYVYIYMYVLYVYIYIYIYTHPRCVYMYIYIYVSHAGSHTCSKSSLPLRRPLRFARYGSLWQLERKSYPEGQVLKQ